MMKILLSDVERLVKEEYDRASEQHGDRFSSPHEAYAVMLEELQEAREALAESERFLRGFWEACRTDDNKWTTAQAKKIQKAAENAASELIQLAAMAYKAQKGYKNEPVD